MQEHTAISAFFDGRVDHRKDQAAGNQQCQWHRGHKGFDDVRDVRMQKKVLAEKRGHCEEPCGYTEEADGRVKRSPSSPCGCSPQPRDTAHDSRVTKQTKTQDNLKIPHAGQGQAEADRAEGRKRRGCPTPFVPGEHSQHGGSACSANRCFGGNQGGRCTEQSDADHEKSVKFPKATDPGLPLKN